MAHPGPQPTGRPGRILLWALAIIGALGGGTGIAALAGAFGGGGGGGGSSPPPTPQVDLACAVAPKPAPGSQVTLTYTITSGGVVADLAADIYDDARDSHTTGFGDLDAYRIPAGTHVKSRPMRIPGDLPPGDYEVVGELWEPSTRGQEGKETIADTVCTTFTVP